jgi:excisionase family DNA binding protein
LSTAGFEVDNHPGESEGAKLDGVNEPRFLRLSDVAEILNISAAQTYALVRSGELKGMKIGGRGQWRVERDQLEAFITKAHDDTSAFVATHPFGRDEVADTVD